MYDGPWRSINNPAIHEEHHNATFGPTPDGSLTFSVGSYTPNPNDNWDLLCDVDVPDFPTSFDGLGPFNLKYVLIDLVGSTDGGVQMAPGVVAGDVIGTIEGQLGQEFDPCDLLGRITAIEDFLGIGPVNP